VSGTRRGVPFVLSAPSGAGKTTVCKGVIARDPGIVVSVSHTTRPPRPGERDGVEYHFVSATEFRKLVADGAFLEHAEYSGNLYGTSWAAIEAPLLRGDDVLLEIETEGARQVREQRRADAHLIFLLPPSLAALELRLRGRGTENAEEVDRRLAIARREFAAAKLFDSFVVNDDAARAVDDVLAIVAAVRRGAAQVDGRFSLARLRATLDPALAAWLPA
jgi:guanylate kinase